MKHLIVILALLCTPAMADTGQEERDALFEVLQSTEDAEIANAAQRAIWESWREAPDEDAQALFDLGMQRMGSFDNVGAVEVFDELVLYAPDFAEGWNQRAFAYFRMDEYEKSLADIESTLQREPRHFGALSGKFRILLIQGRGRLAQKTLRRAVKVNPWLVERRLLVPEAAE
jgi:tetratricopeptide (TPR) repeat protein